MHINDYVSNYKNHPILFIGTGISLRYLNNSYTWDGLLKKISYDFTSNKEVFLDIKSQCYSNNNFSYEKIATQIEADFNNYIKLDRNGKFKLINDTFYRSMEKGVILSGFKIYVSSLLSTLDFKDEMKDEIVEFKKVRKNISSIITTNYDTLVENVFEFDPLVGNNILLSNPYGSVYKIHGCVSDPARIIITEEDYKSFENKYELIRAQLLSMFTHNPIIFLGYNIGDENIKNILKTIFTYVEPNSIEAEKIRANFLLVEYDKGSCSQEICEHDIDLQGFSTIRINKIKTDDFLSIYRALSNLSLSVSAMDIRKVQDVFMEIRLGGSIKVNITENLDDIHNGDKIVAIGSVNTISYQYQTISELMSNYFKIIDESNFQLLKVLNKQRINPTQFFPIFGFSKICSEIEKSDLLKKQQKLKLISALASINISCKTDHKIIDKIVEDESITNSNKDSAILWSAYNAKLELEDVKQYLSQYIDKKCTSYRKILCAYDFKKYGSE
jgi:SIR2-like domain